MKGALKDLADGLHAATFFCTLVTLVSLVAALATGAEILQTYAATGVVITLAFALAATFARAWSR